MLDPTMRAIRRRRDQSPHPPCALVHRRRRGTLAGPAASASAQQAAPSPVLGLPRAAVRQLVCAWGNELGARRGRPDLSTAEARGGRVDPCRRALDLGHPMDATTPMELSRRRCAEVAATSGKGSSNARRSTSSTAARRPLLV
jgi:hypothetical protein